MKDRKVIVCIELLSAHAIKYLKQWYTMHCPYPNLVAQVQANVVKSKENKTKTKKEK